MLDLAARVCSIQGQVFLGAAKGTPERVSGAAGLSGRKHGTLWQFCQEPADRLGSDAQLLRQFGAATPRNGPEGLQQAVAADGVRSSHDKILLNILPIILTNTP